MRKWLVRGVVLLAAIYAMFFGTVLAAMLQPPDRFGAFMRYAPQPAIWAALPARRMWLWARRGELAEGQPAPDFDLRMLDREMRISLASHRGQRPVVLVFGSYT